MKHEIMCIKGVNSVHLKILHRSIIFFIKKGNVDLWLEAGCDLE